MWTHSALRSKWFARLILAAALSGLLASAPLPSVAQTFEEPRFAFVLRTPPGFTGVKSIEGALSTWKLRNSKVGAELGDNELVSVTISALPRSPDRDPEEEFRDYVGAFASQILNGGAVEAVTPRQFAGRPGFLATARGAFDTGSGKRSALARILLMEVDDHHVLASAIALGSGDAAFAAFGTADGLFAPTKAVTAASPSTAQPSERTPKPSDTTTPESAKDEGHLLLIGALAFGALVGAALVLRFVSRRRVASPATTPVPVVASTTQSAFSPVAPQPPVARFCTECGARLTASGLCPACGAPS